MKISVLATYQQLSLKVASEICALLCEKPDAHICIAAGHSSLGIFAELIRLYQNSEIDFSKARFTAMDEWLGMNRDTAGSCGDFLVKNFLSQVNFSDEKLCLVDGKAADANGECQRIHDAIYNHGGLDYILLGVGMNGHLALNEPGTAEDSGVHVSALDSVTKTVGTKYFTDAPSLEGGLTIGIGDIRKAGRVILAINGRKKAEIVKLLAEEPATVDIPATFLKNWEHAEILCDQEAASLIPFTYEP